MVQANPHTPLNPARSRIGPAGAQPTHTRHSPTPPHPSTQTPPETCRSRDRLSQEWPCLGPRSLGSTTRLFVFWGPPWEAHILVPEVLRCREQHCVRGGGVLATGGCGEVAAWAWPADVGLGEEAHCGPLVRWPYTASQLHTRHLPG